MPCASAVERLAAPLRAKCGKRETADSKLRASTLLGGCALSGSRFWVRSRLPMLLTAGAPIVGPKANKLRRLLSELEFEFVALLLGVRNQRESALPFGRE